MLEQVATNKSLAEQYKFISRQRTVKKHKLHEQVHIAFRAGHYSVKTEESYIEKNK